jgi:hypothetical protein
MCKQSIAEGESYNRVRADGSIKILDSESIFVCCIHCGDQENIYCMIKCISKEASI